jgi:hypothetical protein
MRAILAPGSAAWLALVIAAALGCGHDAKPAAQPEDHPPLPPGTPIGYLIDDGSELQLRDDQVTKLKEIDTDLAARLDVLDAQQRGTGHPRTASASGAGGRHRGGRRGGMRRQGAGGGSGSASAAAPSAGSGAMATGGKTEERADDVRAAIARAFEVLDPAQRPIATRVLSDHGVDLDAGRPDPKHPASEPDEPDESDEPDPGSRSGSGGT